MEKKQIRYHNRGRITHRPQKVNNIDKIKLAVT